jgi:hypothetical protein
MAGTEAIATGCQAGSYHSMIKFFVLDGLLR